MDHHGQAEGLGCRLRAPQRLKIIGPGHVVRQSRLDPDDEVAMTPDRPARQTDVGMAEVMQFAAGRGAGSDFPNVMSKFLMFGMPLDQVIACATVNAARAFAAFNDRGTLNVGAPADVAVLELRNGTQRLFPVATVLGGKRSPTRA